jgi:hypothetical protein
MKHRNERIDVTNHAEAMNGWGDASGAILLVLSFFIILAGALCCNQLFGPPSVALGLREGVVQNGPATNGRTTAMCNSACCAEMD